MICHIIDNLEDKIDCFILTDGLSLLLIIGPSTAMDSLDCERIPRGKEGTADNTSKKNKRCPHDTKFPLVEIDMSLCIMINT